jgi:ketosteroid isomerase-like protein
MKRKILRAASFMGIISIFFACNEKRNERALVAAENEQVKVDKEQIKKEIQAKEDAFADVYNKGEMRSIGYYADDATSFFQNRQPLVGKAAIVSFLKSEVTSNTNRITFSTKEVFVSNDANQVLEVGYFKVVDSTNSPINTGNYMTLFEKRNGKYVAVRDMSASDGSIQ